MIKVGDVVTMKTDSAWWNKGDKAKVTQTDETSFEGDFSGNKDVRAWGNGKATWYFGLDDVEEKKKAGDPAIQGIRIKTEKVEAYGEKFVRILEIEALEKKDLPAEYLAGPSVWKDGKRLYFSEEIADRTYFYIGGGYYLENFGKFMAFIKACGIRLEEINKKNREKKKAKPVEGPRKREWSGVKEYVI